MMLGHFLTLATVVAPYAMAQSFTLLGTGGASSSAISSASTPTAISSTPAVSLSPMMTLAPMSTYTACSPAYFEWRLWNVDALLYTVTFRAQNSGIDQSISRTSTLPSSTSAIPITTAPISSSTPIPSSSAVTTSRAAAVVIPSSSSAAVPTSAELNQFQMRQPVKRTKLTINQTIGTNPAYFGWNTRMVLPEGNYMMVATVPDLDISLQTPFTVVETTNTSCLAAFAALSASSSSASSTRSGSSSASMPSGSSAALNAGQASGMGVSTGAIAGAVIGVVVGLAILGLLAFCLIRRKRRRAAEERAGSRDRRHSEKLFGLGGGAAAAGGMTQSRSQRMMSDTTGSPPASSSSHGHSELPYTTSAAVAGGLGESLPRSQRESGDSQNPAGNTRSGPPRLPEMAAYSGDSDDIDPFTTPPGVFSDKYARRSIAYTPATSARPESDVLEPPNRRASSPVDTFGTFDPYAIGAGAKRSSPPGSTIDGAGGMMRKMSAKRKAVPSLGPELRRQMQSSGGVEAPQGRKEFKLMPDKPSMGSSSS